MTQLGKRLVSSAFLVSIACLTIFYAPIAIFILVVEILVLIALFEFYSLAEKKKIQINRILGLVLGAFIPLAVYYQSGALMLVVSCLALFVYNFRKNLLHQALIGTAVTFLGLVYIAWFFSHLIDLRVLPYGPQWIFYIALIVKGGDAGAYFVGKKYGKVKLIEHVSPNKSVEGALGGFATTIVLSLLSKSFIPGVELYHFLFLGIIVGVISQLGDLAESLLKRDAGVKDSGALPGLGGILDVLDSLLLTIPFVYYYVANLGVS